MLNVGWTQAAIQELYLNKIFYIWQNFGLKSGSDQKIGDIHWQLFKTWCFGQRPGFIPKMKALIHHSGLREGLHFGDPGQEDGAVWSGDQRVLSVAALCSCSWQVSALEVEGQRRQAGAARMRLFSYCVVAVCTNLACDCGWKRCVRVPVDVDFAGRKWDWWCWCHFKADFLFVKMIFLNRFFCFLKKILP